MDFSLEYSHKPKLRKKLNIVEAYAISLLWHDACAATWCAMNRMPWPTPATRNVKTMPGTKMSDESTIKAPRPKVLMSHPHVRLHLYNPILVMSKPMRPEIGTMMQPKAKETAPLTIGE